MRHRMSEPASSGVVWRLGMTRGALISVVVLTIAIGIGFWRLEMVSAQGASAKNALCAVRQTTREQVRAQVKFLADVKTGKRPPVPGISDADILESIRRQQKFLSSLDPLDC